MNARFVPVLLTMVLAACADPLEFPEWTLPVPDEIPVAEHAGAPVQGRSERIELVEDLVIDNEGAGGEVVVYRPFDVAVDNTGRMFIVDGVSTQIHLFSPSGEYVRSFGRQGQGPGEFEALGRATVAADRLVVLTLGRFSFWSLEGEFLDELRPSQPVDAWRLEGLADGTFVGMNPGRNRYRVSRFSADGELLGHLVESGIEPDWLPEGKRLPFDRNVRFAVGPDDTVYATTGDHYQIVAMDPSGAVRRGLRVAWAPEPYSGEDFDAFAAGFSSGFDASRFLIPETWPALADIRVDGHGHLYVFPSGHLVYDRDVAEWPVDVYSADGDALFSGRMDRLLWHAYLGDYVYGVSPDPVGEENRVVRYRLVEPF